MSITVTCTCCDWKATRPNEYEAEIAFDNHCREDHADIENMTMQELDAEMGFTHPDGYDENGKRK